MLKKLIPYKSSSTDSSNFRTLLLKILELFISSEQVTYDIGAELLYYFLPYNILTYLHSYPSKLNLLVMLGRYDKLYF
jgi:hypothetical protein